MNTNKLIGKKIKGFWFDNEIYKFGYVSNMDKHIGKIGQIEKYEEVYNCYRVNFKSESWQYPAELIEQHLVEETPLDDLPIIGDGVLMEVSQKMDNWYKKYVIAKSKNGIFIAWNDSFDHIYTWQHARPITPKTKITRKEFESKFEIID
jgi:hypothetical protein